MKKIFSVLFIFLLLIGCSNEDTKDQEASTNNSDEVTTIEAWVLPFVSEEKWAELESEFNSSHEDIQVNLTVLPWSNGREQIKTSLSTGNGPDAFYIPVGLDQDYIDGSILEPVTSLGVTDEDLAKFHPVINTNSVDGEIYALPLAYDLVMLFYNKELLAAHGFDSPPATYDELYTMSKTISDATTNDGKPEIMGVQFRGMDEHQNFMNHTWETLFRAEGGDYITDGESSINSPEGVKALTYLKRFYEEKISIPGPSAIDGFENGTIAMFPYIQTAAPDRDWYNKAEFKDKWEMAPMPKGSVSSSSYLGGHSIAVNANSSHVDEAAVFMRWIASPQNATIWMGRNLVPAIDVDQVDSNMKAEFESVIEERPDTWDAIYTQFNANIDANIVDLQLQKRLGYTQRWNSQTSQFISAATGQTPIEEALEQVDRQVDQGIKR